MIMYMGKLTYTYTLYNTWIYAFSNTETNYIFLLLLWILLNSWNITSNASSSIEKTIGLVILLISMTFIAILTSNTYLGLIVFILEMSTITAIILINQSFNPITNRKIPWIVLLILLPYNTIYNDYFVYYRHYKYISISSSEPLSAMYKSIVMVNEHFSLIILLILIVTSLIIAIYISLVFNVKLKARGIKLKNLIKKQKILLYSKNSNLSKIKTARPNTFII